MRKDHAMTCPGYTDVLDLAPGESLDLLDAAGTTLRVTRGRLWLTMEHDPRDIVIEPGDVFTIDRPGHTIAHAQEGATVCAIRRGSIARRSARPQHGSLLRFLARLLSLDAAKRGTPVPYY